jgi:DNA-directed RNA polymerase sigma subunit (sigma70/sigma32)
MVAMTHKARRERRQQIADYADKHSIEKAAKHFAVCVETVLASLREHNMPTGRKRTPDVSSFRILLRLLDGSSGQDIATDLGITRQRVNQIKQKAKAAGFTF